MLNLLKVIIQKCSNESKSALSTIDILNGYVGLWVSFCVTHFKHSFEAIKLILILTEKNGSSLAILNLAITSESKGYAHSVL